jgi:hypothetical protein
MTFFISQSEQMLKLSAFGLHAKFPSVLKVAHSRMIFSEFTEACDVFYNPLYCLNLIEITPVNLSLQMIKTKNCTIRANVEIVCLWLKHKVPLCFESCPRQNDLLRVY